MVDAFLQTGLRHGHFVFESGDHGDVWLQLERLFTSPRSIRQAAEQLAGKLRRHQPDLVCGPALGGALVGQWVASALDVRFVYAERRVSRGAAAYAIPPGVHADLRGARVAIVDDVVNAGAAALGEWTQERLKTLNAAATQPAATQPAQ